MGEKISAMDTIVNNLTAEIGKIHDVMIRLHDMLIVHEIEGEARVHGSS